MDWKFLLKPEWRKFVLPIILVVMLLYVSFSSASIVTVFDKYTCEISDLSKQYIAADKQNNTEVKDSINQSSEGIRKKISEDVNKINALAVREFAFFLSTINPLTPLPCELTLSPLCTPYMNKKSYDCLADLANFTKQNIENRTIAENIKIREYSEPTAPIIYNSIIVFVEGYIISAVALGLYRKSKKKRDR